MEDVLSGDFETRAAKDLPKVGVHLYAADPDTDVWCLALASTSAPQRSHWTYLKTPAGIA